MTDTTASFSPLLLLIHPVRAWHALLAAQAARADDEASDAGLTVDVLPGGVRRYRDPALDGLAASRARQNAAVSARLTSTPRLVPLGPCLNCAAVLHVNELTGERVDPWGQAVCGASYGAHLPDVPVLPDGPAAPATGIPDRRTERGGPAHRVGPGLTRTAPPASSRSAQDRFEMLRTERFAETILRSRLDPEDPSRPW
jgi:hypothetical protein